MSFRLPLVIATQLLPLMEECEVLIVSDEGGETEGKTADRRGERRGSHFKDELGFLFSAWICRALSYFFWLQSQRRNWKMQHSLMGTKSSSAAQTLCSALLHLR